MDVFDLRESLIRDYNSYIQSFLHIKDRKIREYVDDMFERGDLWPEALIQLNPSFEQGSRITDLVNENVLHSECNRIFKIKEKPDDPGKPLRLHKHQSDAVRAAKTNQNYVLTTGTGSGKSLAYIIPIVDYVLRNGSGKGIKAIVVYPMNALANSQLGELEKFIEYGYPKGAAPVKFARYTGQESQEQKNEILNNPPDILLTNYVMLELILTRTDEKQLISAAMDLKFLVFDELHTYRGRQGADVAYLARRVKQKLEARDLQYVGTSATLSTEGTFIDQQKKIAEVATQLFGSPVMPEHVIGETLKRVTEEQSVKNPDYVNRLKQRVAQDNSFPTEYNTFIEDPLASWIESTFGLSKEPDTRRLVRSIPRPIGGNNGAAKELAQITGEPFDKCASIIKRALLAGHFCAPHPQTGFRPFAFRIHQFISKGDTVYCSIEDENDRHVTVSGQQYVPNANRQKILLPMAFCRECGQEYYLVRYCADDEGGDRVFCARELSDQVKADNDIPGFLFRSESNPWPDNDEEIIDRLPQDWIIEQNGRLVVRNNRQEYLPSTVGVLPNGRTDDSGLSFQFFASPFRFCLNCGVSYGIRQYSDFPKLSTLSSEGRSTATTILGLSTIRYLKNDTEIRNQAKKLLSFTDNRQDASLQAGHFNDFVEIGWLRAALFKAVSDYGSGGLGHDEIADKVFDALNLPLKEYAVNPAVRYRAETETKKALRNVLGYRIYRDLKKGWRITSPNLEQCGMLEIQYESLEELCANDDDWSGGHPALISASHETRATICKVLLDFMRRELAIKVDYLDTYFQDRIKQQSNQYLVAPWAIDEDERMTSSATLYPRSRNRPGDSQWNVYMSGRGGYGMYLRRGPTLPEYGEKLSVVETEEIIVQILHNLEIAGIVEAIDQQPDNLHGYQLKASCLRWIAGDGTKAFYDPIRVPNRPDEGMRTNPFFIDFYKETALKTLTFEGREHTAQVPYEKREERENRFKEAELPILFCSPTMELGVDIAELNVVNMRNIPPTPANYAQRSGRAGRSGQPALVFSYCSTGSSHDQYFFKRPQLMVSGKVSPPRIDLANEDLVKAHIQAVWLGEANLNLHKSLRDILDLAGDEPSLDLIQEVKDALKDKMKRLQAHNLAEQVLNSVKSELEKSDWYKDNWLNNVLNQVYQAFEIACNRWRELYWSALNQAKNQTAIIHDASRSAEDRRKAEQLRKEAEAQLKLLTEVENIVQSDFYSYRYFASEGFLPGYNFPRLPISAYIAARRIKQKDKDEFLSRPRFLAISEFGPRSIIYHEGSRYIINKVIMPVRDSDELNTSQAKVCQECGYLHPVNEEINQDMCELCGTRLEQPLRSLFRLQNVSTKRRDRISSDEEERLRLGYEILTGVRFGEHGHGPAYQKGVLQVKGSDYAELFYGHTATIWRVNLGWRRRANPNQVGFLIDKERGFWERNEQLVQDGENGTDEQMSDRVERVIPYVEDRRNSLIFKPLKPLTEAEMASLQSALKNAIQVLYQLEDNELAVDPLPTAQDRQQILFYESAEGGAGVLRRLVSDPEAFSLVAKKALEICHYEPETGDDQGRAPGAREDCEAACYDCLMNYGNQRDHELLDRKAIAAILMEMAQSNVSHSPGQQSREEHLSALVAACESQLEREWLYVLEKHGLKLPDQAQYFIEKMQTRPDFFYKGQAVAVYVDGPHHDYPERKERDAAKTDELEDRGYMVLRFGHTDDWLSLIKQYPGIFGTLNEL